MNKNQCLDSLETKSEELGDKGGDITFKGWDIKNPEKVIKEELEEYFEENDIIDFEIKCKREHAFSCPRFFEEEDAKDSGYNYWLEFEDTWKKGLGKCTTFTIKYNLINKEEKKNNERSKNY